jgi:hypothetical protein
MLKKTQKNKDLLAIAAYVEIVDNKLWFQGYSIYRTAWCKKWIALQVFDPNYQGGKFDISYHYKQALQDWTLHHLPLLDEQKQMPQPPKLFQFENAFEYLNYYLPLEIKNHQRSTNNFWNIEHSPLLRKFQLLLKSND